MTSASSKPAEKQDAVRAPEVLAFFHEQTSSASYLVFDPETKAAAIIDAVLDFDIKSGRTWTAAADAMLDAVRERGLSVQWVLETHLHADHLSAGGYLRDKLRAKLGIGDKVPHAQAYFSAFYNVTDLLPDGSQYDHLFADGETFTVGGLPARVIATPGHTPTCVTYLIGDAAFTGDLIFMPDYGTARCDFPGGSARQLYRSIQRLFALPDETRLFTGHDYAPGGRAVAWESTVAEQRSHNKHVGGGATEDAFVAVREERDRGLEPPNLILPALQVNMRGGRLPAPEANGTAYLKIPLNAWPARGATGERH